MIQDKVPAFAADMEDWALRETFRVTSVGGYALPRDDVAALLRAIRREALEEAGRAVDDEHLEDPNIDDDSDISYDTAINDAHRAVLSLRDKDPS